MREENGRPRVAIACQGGGSHTAFGAGVLKRLLRDERYDFVALSGTSGGAICAFLAWHALSRHDGGPERAASLLNGFWEDNSAGAPYERFWNDWLVWVNRLQGSAYLPSVSPYGTPLSYWAQDELRRTLERQVGPGETERPAKTRPCSS